MRPSSIWKHRANHLAARVIALALAGFGCAALALPEPTPAVERPNILFLFTDDQRFDTVHELGNEVIRTPNLDRLVREGVSFDRAYIMGASSPAVCTPSRACLFSGRTLWNLASQGLYSFAIPERFATFPEVLRRGGYLTFTSGKNDPGFGREDHFARSFAAGASIYYRGGHRGQDRTPLFDPVFRDDGVGKKKLPTVRRFNAEIFADACVDFLQEREEESEPFLAYVSFMTPHDPLNAPAEYLDMYDPEAIPLPKNFQAEHPFDAGIHDIRDERLMSRPLTATGLRQRLAKYYGLVTHTDTQIGRILDALEQSGQAERTVIIFSSDNGLALGSHGLLGKQNVYEHSVRVPLILSGPGIPRGERRSQLCYLYDIYPTLCDLAGQPIPETVQYRSLRPAIGDASTTHREHLYFAFMSQHRAIRDERYKLIEYVVDGARHTQLFDLEDDPAETVNLAGDESHATTLARLRDLLESEARRLHDGESEADHLRAMADAFWSGYREGEE